jgi:predicted site-specific integrase-resolvase
MPPKEGVIVKIYKPKEVAKKLNVTVKTLQNWDNDRKFIAKRNACNRRYYTEEQLNDFLGLKNHKQNNICIYARVSNRGQKDDLINQIEFLRQYANARGYIVQDVYEDVGSGLNYKRKSWNDILEKIQNYELSKVIVAHKDRFVRFGYDWFETFARRYGCEIEIVNNEKLSPQEEMVQDLISIIHVFSCRIYGLRKYKVEVERDKEL